MSRPKTLINEIDSFQSTRPGFAPLNLACEIHGTENRSLNLNKNLLGINAVIRSINNSAPKLNGHS
jgi:hypothetical protein